MAANTARSPLVFVLLTVLIDAAIHFPDATFLLATLLALTCLGLLLRQTPSHVAQSGRP